MDIICIAIYSFGINGISVLTYWTLVLKLKVKNELCCDWIIAANHIFSFLHSILFKNFYINISGSSVIYKLVSV